MVAPSEAHLDRTFGALAHPIRRAILTRLARGDGASVTELAHPFDVSLMAVSKHVKVMEEAGLIRRERDGRVHRCHFDPKAFDQAGAWIERHRRFWNRQLDALAAYLEEPAERGDPDRAEDSEPPDHGGEER